MLLCTVMNEDLVLSMAINFNLSLILSTIKKIFSSKLFHCILKMLCQVTIYKEVSIISTIAYFLHTSSLLLCALTLRREFS